MVNNFLNSKNMQKIKIQVFGSGCPTCEMLYNRVSKVAKEISPELEVDYITNIRKMVELGAMSSPVFAIDKRIITAGQLPEEEEIKKAIEARLADK